MSNLYQSDFQEFKVNDFVVQTNVSNIARNSYFGVPILSVVYDDGIATVDISCTLTETNSAILNSDASATLELTCIATDSVNHIYDEDTSASMGISCVARNNIEFNSIANATLNITSNVTEEFSRVYTDDAVLNISTSLSTYNSFESSDTAICNLELELITDTIRTYAYNDDASLTLNLECIAEEYISNVYEDDAVLNLSIQTAVDKSIVINDYAELNLNIETLQTTEFISNIENAGSYASYNSNNKKYKFNLQEYLDKLANDSKLKLELEKLELAKPKIYEDDAILNIEIIPFAENSVVINEEGIAVLNFNYVVESEYIDPWLEQRQAEDEFLLRIL